MYYILRNFLSRGHTIEAERFFLFSFSLSIVMSDVHNLVAFVDLEVLAAFLCDLGFGVLL